MALQPSELVGAAEIIPNKLYFQCLSQPVFGVAPDIAKHSICYYLDNDLIYEPFCADFGPCNLAHTYRFCQRVNQLLQQGEEAGKSVYLLVGPHPNKRSNAAALMGIYSVIYSDKTPEQAYAPMLSLEPWAGFRDASCGVPTYLLHIPDVIRGMWRAKQVGFINWHQGEVFDVEKYEHYEQVENGDLNWIVPGKLMAFSGPSATPRHFGGWRTYTPEDYIPYFNETGVSAVIRLNKKMYDAARFTAYGVKHHEMYFPDGTCPTEQIMYRFLELVEKEPGALAVHCKAGLGRTGVLICCYMIKHYGFTAEEALGYIRVCRPGSVIGPQQLYLLHYGPRLAAEGVALRKAMDTEMSPTASMDEDVCMETFSSIPSVDNKNKKSVIKLTATSTFTQQPVSPQTNVRRSPRLSNGTMSMSSAASSVSTSNNGDATTAPVEKQSATNTSALRMSRLEIQREPAHIISVPTSHLQPSAPISPQKPGNARGAPLHIHVEAETVILTPSRSATTTPVRMASHATLDKNCPTPPPSSTKRVLAPNGQPRKIPLAMDFSAADLVDRAADEGEDSWTVGSRPAQDKYKSDSRVGAFAAAAGRGASAFVEAFRLAVGGYRTGYRSNYSLRDN